MSRVKTKERTCMTLDADVVKALAEISAKYEVPVSRIVNSILRDWITRGKKWPLE